MITDLFTEEWAAANTEIVDRQIEKSKAFVYVDRQHLKRKPLGGHCNGLLGNGGFGHRHKSNSCLGKRQMPHKRFTHCAADIRNRSVGPQAKLRL